MQQNECYSFTQHVTDVLNKTVLKRHEQDAKRNGSWTIIILFNFLVMVIMLHIYRKKWLYIFIGILSYTILFKLK